MAKRTDINFCIKGHDLRIRGTVKKSDKHTACYQCALDNSAKHRKANKDRYRSYILKCRYGITQDAYNQHLFLQDYRCLICRLDSRRLVVDHNHKTKEFRGLLCDSCNHFVGLYENNINLVPLINKYIKENNTNED